jgi:NAD(P)-dependent dehydrogenase (short-subunit alcohol dehydrogenase family)
MESERNIMTKCTMITGAASGIGLACAQRFAAEGHALVLVDRNAEGLETAAKSLPVDTPALLCAGSVTEPNDVATAFAQATERFGGVDAVITSAGIVKATPSVDVTPDDFRAHLEVNVMGSWLFAQAAARNMIERSAPGAIVMIGSVYGASGAPHRAAYCASKGAVHNLVQSLAVEWGPYGIRVNTVAPTGVRTPMVQALIDEGKYNTAGVKARTPLGRLAEADEIANACWFLASDQAAMTTGAVLAVDGGWLANGYTFS